MNDECSVWRDHRTAARPPEDSTRRLYVDAYTGDEFFTVCFPWGNEKMAGVVGLSVEDPCQGKWVLVKAFLSGIQPWEPSHIFVFEYVPKQPRIETCPLYTNEDVDELQKKAYNRGYEAARTTYDSGRADERSLVHTALRQLKNDFRFHESVANADIANDVYKRNDDYARGNAGGRGWAFSHAQHLLKKYFPKHDL